ncbi:MAG: D-glycero-beta-D-manno-heptose 1-phosphate adenylyltransferase [Thermodesulfobacteriota bacterium]|nr:D-glycero-beta-D-manno-heptose 1-phosphate adenylyltransferase [Thermodesulfobacteriota bacterium]
MLNKTREKIKTLKDMISIVKRLHSEGRTVVFTNGCFDIIHAGHIFYLEKAKEFGDFLIVGLNSDVSIRKIKGEKRPLIPQKQRAIVLSALECVDYVLIFDEENPLKLISLLSPHILVKGGDWTKENIIGRDIVEEKGGKVYSLPLLNGVSTSGIIETILKNFKN